jgi:2-dehydro-3-deoxyphosphogluconate aldolase / (4S)-4-hydroxy-2-oxoglutarate aldolase
MDNVFEQLGLVGIVPVLTINQAADAVPLAKALVAGGLSCVEVTFRTEAAKESLSLISKAGFPILLGAGTVQSVDQVKQAVECGARFIVSPGLNVKVVEYCLKTNIPVIPGAATPTEFEQATGFGLEVLKFFPAEASGGVEYLEAIRAPYKEIKFIPTGGIDESNVVSYLKLPGVLACGGSWMVKSDLIANRRFDEIQMLAAKAVKTMLGFKLRHIGINSGTSKEAEQTASVIADMFQLESKDNATSIFVGTEFELLKSKYLGDHGHVAIGTNSIERAVAYFDRKGIKTKPDTRSECEGKLATIYLDITIGGFAVHLVQL